MAGDRLQRRGWLAAAAAGILSVAAVAATAAFTGGAAASLTGRPHARPDVHPRSVAGSSAAGNSAARTAFYPVMPFVQDFSDSTRYFCPAGSGNLPCDGKINADYGTIDRVASRFSNGGAGNYAPFTRALHGRWMALASGAGMPNQGAACPSNAVEACSGPYALFGTGQARGHENVFPSHGFTVTNDLYLSPATAGPAGSPIDDDVELNLAAPGAYSYYGIDNIITACPQAGGFVINFGHNSPGSCSGSPVITRNGWYRFVFMFSNAGGDAYVTEFVRSEPTGALVATSGRQPAGGGSPEPISHWGGPGYFWLPTLDVSGLPLANFALQLGQVPGGHRP